jgi:glycosyltransferase involved in cell wall biosynthesis
MKVLHVIESLEFGGAEKVVVDLANALVERVPVGICCVKRIGELRDALDARIAVHCLNKQEGNDFGLPRRLARLASHDGYDVVHSHTWGVFLEPALARTRRAPRRLVHTVHGRYLEYPPGIVSRLKRRLRRVLEQWLARRYDAVVAVSASVRDYVAGNLRIAEPRLVTIHNGIRARASVAAPRPEGSLTFITVGRLAPVKNQGLMVGAFARVAREHGGARLRIVGDGPERAALEGQVRRLGLDRQVELLGFRDDVDALLAEAHVFLMSSHYEGISIAILEAMRARLPVVASRVGGVPDTVTDERSGILFVDGDEEGMARAMGRLARSARERREMGEEGCRRLEQEFSMDAMVAKYYALYRAGEPD